MRRCHLGVVMLALCAWLNGCTPAGPRALLQGEKLIQEGKYTDAIAKLRTATELMPKSAQAWNHLGLACQGNQQPDEALKAYRMALSLDHKLAAARYNLGCLHLEQNNLIPAADELTSFTLLQPGLVDGWLKLGQTHLRLRRLDYAEHCFKAALDVHPRHPEAFNGLGMVQFQRRRWQEAANYFNAALARSPNYAAALLNSAVVQQQGLNNRAAALQRYRQYLALQPRPADADLVEATVRQLDPELKPVPTPVLTQAVAQATFKPVVTSVVAATTPSLPKTSPPALTATPKPATNPPAPPPVVVAALPRTSTPPAAPVKVTPPPAPVNPPVAASPAVDPPRATVRAPDPPQPAVPVLEVTQLANDLVVKPPQELRTHVPTRPMADAGNSGSPVAPADSGTNTAKRSFLAMLNPFNGRPKPENGAAKAPIPPGTNARPTEPPPIPAAAPSSVAAREPVQPPAPSIPRHTFLSPPKPTPGNRTEAEQFFARGLQAQQSGRNAQAINEYQSAVKSDPAYFDAYYNLALAAFDAGDVKLSLWAGEIALALKPESAKARYNFALALKTGGYFQDAADQLQTLILSDGDARAHLSLANLFAQQLRQPARAREHYQKVLELEPRHPEASRIRYWLGANP